MIVFGIAAAAHATAVFGPELLRSRPEKPRITQQVAHEGIQDIKKSNKPDVNLLKEERKKYLTELLYSLRKGVKIKLSDFLIKSQVLDKNIELAEAGEFGLGEGFVRREYLRLMRRAKYYVKDREDKIKELHRFLHTKVFEGYFWDSGSILDVLGRGWYNCLSSTETFSALLEDVLGIEDYRVVLFDDHIASFVKGKAIENTDHAWKTAKEKYKGCGLIVPREIFIAAYLVKHGISHEELPSNLLALYETKKVWKGCSLKKKGLISDNLKEDGFPNPDVGSGLTLPPYFVPNPNFELEEEKIVEMAKGVFAAYQMSHITDERRFLKTKIDGKQMLVKPITIPGDVDWGEVLERFVWYFGFSDLTPFLTEEVKCCIPFFSIKPEAIPDIIEGLPAKEKAKFEHYTRESICGRYKEVVEGGTIEQLKKYLSYSFCTGLSEPLKRRYAKERDEDILWFGLGSMGLPENFDFLLNEFKSGNERIKHSAAWALILSDVERACKVMKTLPKDERKPSSKPFGWACRDVELAWKTIHEFKNKRIVDEKDNSLELALEFIGGSGLSPQQYETLKDIAKDIPLYSRLDFARILYEYGDKETADRYVEETVDIFINSDDTAAIWLCNFPKEATNLMVPLLKKKPVFAMEIAKGLICHGNHRDYISEIVGPLRDFVVDNELDLSVRVEAAFILLQLGVDSVEETQQVR